MGNFLTLKKIKNYEINLQSPQTELIDTPRVSKEKNSFCEPFSFIAQTEKILNSTKF